MILLLDEVLTKGYGLGSGVQLFIAVNVCERVVWSALSFRTLETIRGPEYEGAIIALFHMLLWSRSDKIMAFRDAFYRPDLPNVTSIIATGIIFVAAIYFQGYRIDLAVKYMKVRGQMGNYPIKLFYTGNMPMILQSALVGNIYFFSQMLYNRFKTSYLVAIIGTWQQVDVTGNSVPVGGLAYYISPPQSFIGIFTDPFHSIFYFLFMILVSAFLSWKWIEVSGTSARDVAKQLKDQNLTIPGHRDGQLTTVLSRYIPQAAALGGVCVALLTIVADLLGCVGGGTGILLAVTIVYSFFETIMKEREQNGGFL